MGKIHKAISLASQAFVKKYVDSKTGMDLIWENPKPTSSFSEQTIELDLKGYREIRIDMRLEDGSSIVESFTIPVNEERYTIVVMYNSRGVRHVTANTTGVTFGVGHYANSGGATLEDNNEAAVPQKIYGVK